LAIAVACCATISRGATAQTQAMSAAERAIRAADSMRFAAMTRTDFTALDTLLGDDLSYTHNDGSRQGKAGLLNDLRSGELSYLALQPDSVVVRTYGTAAVVDGRVLIRARSGTQQGSFTARFLEVYAKRDGRWELVAWQSTRLTPIVLEK
jgi:ketosteroid isomerase-like protein